MLMAGKGMATTPTVRESSWYIWSTVARRALSYLRQQPEVARDRIGAFGVSMGGTTIWSFALDPRLKAACAIYGCGWNRYYRHTPRYGVSEKLPAMTEDDRVWLAGMAPEGCAPFIKCPVLFLSAANDNYGNMDRAYGTLARMLANVERRQAFTPRFCHHIGADFDQNLFLWMGTWLKGGPAWPRSPVARITLGPDGVPAMAVTADRSAEVERVAIYYAVENHRTVSRNWREAAVVRAGAAWRATLPVLNTGAFLFAFANVRYKSGVHLTSNEEAVIPFALGVATATDAVSRMLYDGSDGTGLWFSESPCTGLRFKIFTAAGEVFKVTLHANYSWPGQKTWEASVTLTGQPGWQTITLAPSDFKAQEPGGVPVNFAHCETLQLTGPWKDRNIVFTDFQWVTQ